VVLFENGIPVYSTKRECGLSSREMKRRQCTRRPCVAARFVWWRNRASRASSNSNRRATWFAALTCMQLPEPFASVRTPDPPRRGGPNLNGSRAVNCIPLSPTHDDEMSLNKNRDF
jgi:hypothetical protein